MGEKKHNKKMIIALVITILLMVIIIGIIMMLKKNNKEEIVIKDEKVEFDLKNNINNAEIEGDIKKNIAENVFQEKTVGDLKIKTKKLELDNSTGMTTYTARVTNNGNDLVEPITMNIKFVNEDNNEIASISLSVETLKKGETKNATTLSTFDIANAYDYIVEIY